MKYVLERPPPRPSAAPLEQELNDEQRAVVAHPGGPMLVIAGAGTGKTRTLTTRVARLLRDGVPPERVLVCTFTNRAAREMLRRVETLLGADVRRLWGGTFHHIANLALRRHAAAVGLPENYGILDREDAKDLLAACLADEGKALSERRYPRPAVLLGIFSLEVNCNLGLEEAVRRRAPRFLARLDDLERVRRRFAERKASSGVVDFDDLLLLLRHFLADHPDAGALRERFEHVLVDEYQDTNHLQAEIVDLVARGHGNVMVVGDDAQSIYSFRGADVGNILGFPQRWPGTSLFHLTRNYRSTPEILALANRALERNVRQFEKHLRATRPSGPRPVRAEVGDVLAQAAFVAQRVLELSQEEGVPLGAIAVLYRAHAHSLELQVELVRRQIPYVVRSGVRFFEQAHLKDVLAYLRVLHNARDELAWTRLLRLWQGFGARSAGRVREAAAAAPAGVRAPDVLAGAAGGAGLPGSARASADRLSGLLDRWASLARPDEVVRAIVGDHYGEAAEAIFENAQVRLEDLRQLAEFAARFESVEAFLG
ncbi:MAG: ATP-dependent helicase, partial [Myxococcota bacterium]